MNQTTTPRHLRIVSAETPAPTGSGSDLAALGRMLVQAVDQHVSEGLALRKPGESMLRALDTSGRLLALGMLAPSGRGLEILEPWLTVTGHAAAPALRRELAAARSAR